MRRQRAFFSALVLMTGFAFAQDIRYSTLVPKSAISMGLGGVFSAIPTSTTTFFGNPASFASKNASWLLPDVEAWAYVRPTASNLGSLMGNANNWNALLSTASELMPQNGGTGGGASTGLGYLGKGIGLGFFVTTDNYVEGSSPAGATLNSDTEATVIVGLGFPVRLGPLNLSVGGDLRPFYHVRIHDLGQSNAALSDVVGGSGSLYTDAFFGTAMDLGATMKLADFTVGLSIRDIAPTYPIATTTLNELKSDFAAGNLPTTGSTTAVLTPNVSAGVSWTPKLVPHLVEPALYLELADAVSVIQDWNGPGSALNLLHVGAEVKLFNFIMLRTGLNRGWLSAGAGFRLLFLDLNAAVFTEELGPLPGDQPRSGLAIQAAIRF